MEAYRVPFELDRRCAPRYRLVNRGSDALRWVRCELDGPGLLAAPAVAARLEPGDAVELNVRGRRLAESTRLMVRWLRPDGTEFLWAASF